MHAKLPVLLFLLLACSATAQNDPGSQPAILDADILSVQLYLRGAPLTFPIVELRSAGGTLVLGFDRLGTDVRDYLYTLEHYNADWTRSDLADNEYLDGFTEDRLVEFSPSFNTLQQYVHYSLSLPNANMRWTKSGNYLLKVYDNTNDKTLVLVRRFLVVEPQWSISAELAKTARVDKLDSHHEIDFSVGFKNSRITNPQREVKAYVLQNGRWDSAIGPLAPFVVRQDQLVYDYQDKIVFPGGKEWRYFDMRTFDYRGEFVKSIVNRRDYYEVTLTPDESRSGRSYIFYGDLNGRFSIENTNASQGLDECDYAEVLFSLKQNLPFQNEDVYVFGELTDWQLKPEFKMRYEESVHAYICEAYLKQGYYNYQYLLVDRKTGVIDEEGLEGNSYEAGNLYYILVYYRPFGERYDRLVATTALNSRPRQ